MVLALGLSKSLYKFKTQILQRSAATDFRHGDNVSLYHLPQFIAE